MRKMLTLVGGGTMVVKEGAGLSEIARILNTIPKMKGDRAQIWGQAEFIVLHATPHPWGPGGKTILASWVYGDSPSIGAAVTRFNQWTQKIPTRLIINRSVDKRGAEHIQPDVEIQGEEGLAAWMLWRWYFWGDHRNRLKRCPQCRKWFVDRTRNGSMVRCSTACTNKWWTLDRRQKAGHDVPGSTRNAKRRVTP